MIEFAEIKQRANNITEAYGKEDFQEVFDREFDIRELHPSDLNAITRLADVYKSVKDGNRSREEAERLQKEIKEEWKRDIH